MSELKRKFYTRPAPAGATPATLKGKPAARFLDKGGKPVVAPLTASGGRVRLPVNMWYGEYLDAPGVRRCEALSPNKDAAKKMLRDIEARVQFKRAGLVTPRPGTARRHWPSTSTTGSPRSPAGAAAQNTSR